jgi:8-oxo-dGTP pyrophosphatase MutT (NUDIX family)
MVERYAFQYCPKLVVFSADGRSVLLAKRKDEADYNGVYSFIGGKLDVSDGSIAAGLRREKTEEIGTACQIKVALNPTINLQFAKSDGSSMILPHHYAEFVDGDIHINPGEYSEYAWVELSELGGFEPKIPSIPHMVEAVLRMKPLLAQGDFTTL